MLKTLFICFVAVASADKHTDAGEGDAVDGGAVAAAAMPAIVAHRGASQEAPENTIASFELAWEQGADAIEGDFFLTSDGHIVCTHDAYTGRFNKPAVAINQTPLAELRKLDFGAWFGAGFAGERIPTIAEVFATVPPGKQIYIELKVGKHIVAPLKAAIDTAIDTEQITPEQIVIMSFKEETVAESKLLMPQIKVLLDLYEGSIAHIRDTVASTQADGVSINKFRVTATLAASLMLPEVGGYVRPHIQ